MGREAKKENEQKRQDDLRKELDYDQQYLSIEELETRYTTSRHKGLTTAQVAINQEKFGRNELTPPHTMHPFLKFLMQFANFFAALLVGGSILCFVAYGIDSSDGEADASNLWLGVVLISVVTITAVFSYYQEAASEKIMEGFKTMIPKITTVYRDGAAMVLEDAGQLTIGDLVEINAGDQVPADVRVIESNDMKVDNASLTGESEPQSRKVAAYPHPDQGGSTVAALEANNLAFYTTNVSSGSGKGFVIGIGDNTAMGKIAGLVTGTDAEETPISKEIKTFILLISIIAVTLGVTFLIVSIALGQAAITSIVFAIGIIVANVPEGLLVTVTVALALTAKRMFAKNVLVKNLQAVETLGSTSVIASDKTGTLTQNRMTVQHCWVGGKVYRVPTARNQPQLAELVKAKKQNGEALVDTSSRAWNLLKRVAVLCNNSKLIYDAEAQGTGGKSLVEASQSADFNLLGLAATSDASEQGLVKAVQLFRDVEEERAANPKTYEVPFNSTNKYQLSIHAPEDSNEPLLVFKGAPERVINFCSYIVDAEGKEVELDAAGKASFNAAYETLGGYGERVLGFAYKSLKGKSDKHWVPEKDYKPASDLVFAGLFALIDPPKEGVPEAVETCKRASIRVFMVTGDHPITAVAIAKQVGIIDQERWDAGEAAVVKGDDIRDWMTPLDEATAAEEALLAQHDVASGDALAVGSPEAKRYAELRAKREEGRTYAQGKFDEALRHPQLVFARVSPAHKLLIVENAQRNGEIVAVTGDGVNDAPALKKGDIGIAMGIAGKDVSKEAADMILMDDNFASIVNGIEEGRLIFDNLKKSISYTLTSNIPEIMPFLVFITINIPLPIGTILILCVDLGTDMVPAISLAYEDKEQDIMLRAPRNAATDRLVNRRLMTFAYLQIGVIQALAGFFAYMVVMNDYGYVPRILVGNGSDWEKGLYQLVCEIDNQGRPLYCGYGCGTPKTYTDETNGAEKNWSTSDGWCYNGCQAPQYGFADFVVEFNDRGFRGYSDKQDFINNNNKAPNGKTWSLDNYNKYNAVCARTCQSLADWGLAPGMDTAGLFTDGDFADWLARCGTAVQSDGATSATTLSTAYRLNVTAGNGNIGIRSRVGPDNNDSGRGRMEAPRGGWYWWNGFKQLFPNPHYQQNVLFYAQTAYFITIIVVQWADLLISKTRKLSIFQQGMNNGFMNFGLVFETTLGLILCYAPPFWNLGLRPIFFLHWFIGVPFSMMIFVYDEVRKMLIRRKAFGGWLELTYW